MSKTLQPTGIFRILEIRFTKEQEISRGTEAEMLEMFEVQGDRLEQMYHDTDPEAFTSSCWLVMQSRDAT